MTVSHALADRVAARMGQTPEFDPAIVDAMRLADMFSELKPEEFAVPVSDTFELYRPVQVNRMLVRHG